MKSKENKRVSSHFDAKKAQKCVYVINKLVMFIRVARFANCQSVIYTNAWWSTIFCQHSQY